MTILTFARTVTVPTPVKYACLTLESPIIVAPVGKSGAGIYSISFSTVISGFSIKASVPLITSVKLCGGILVAIPTAIPDAPLTSKFGNLAGKIAGSFSDPS